MKSFLKRYSTALAKLLLVLLISVFSFALGNYVGYLVNLEHQARVYIEEPVQ